MKIIMLFGLLTLTMPAMASAHDLFDEPCRRAGIPRELAVAIAKQESGLNPWVINVAGKDYVPKSYEEAVKIIRQAEAEGKSFDVGIMQLNSQWFKKWQIDPVRLLDPVENVERGILVLSEVVNRFGLDWPAVGKYHSPTKERGMRYAWKVYKHLVGGNASEVPKAMPATRKTAAQPAQNLYDRPSLWRHSSQQPKGRLITFGVREQGVDRLPNQFVGETAGHSGSSESKQ